MATPRLSKELAQQAIDLACAHGSIAAGGRALGIPQATFKNRHATGVAMGLEPQVQRLAAGEPAAPPEGYKLKGTSTLYNAEGQVAMQWIKTDASLEKLREMQEAAFKGICADLKPLKKIPGPKNLPADLLNLYTLTDCHVGQLSWGKETGEDWDLKIAEQCLVDTFVQMIDAAPPAKVGIVNQLGDFLHQDGLQAMTPTSHHMLDADSRFQRMVEVAVRILRRIIERALVKHEHVQVYMFEGNHDISSSVWLRVLFAQLYEKNPRLTVGMSPNPYECYQHGKTLLGFHHGHLSKPTNLPQLFAAKFAKEWGVTEYRYVHTGHKHHVSEVEHPGIKTIQHPTLTAPDAYAARGGWLSKRQATSMTYHKDRGEVARGIFIPEGPSHG